MLKNCGYDYELKFQEKSSKSSKKSRSRKVLWFNPPFSAHVKTNIGQNFLKILDETFKKDNPLSKIFNRTCTKISYRTSPNLAAIIAKHNAKLLKQGTKNWEID